MKNLIIKKVALGLFLAGYAASSAFALDSVTSTAIVGNPPVMKSLKANPEDHTMTLRISKDEAGTQLVTNAHPKVGDYIHIKYKLTDADGDTDLTEKLMKTLSVSVKRNTSDTTWTEVTSKITPKITHVTDSEEATITFKITSDFAGMNYVAYNIKERTDFGNPNYNLWLRVSDIFSNTNPDTKEPVDENDNTLTDVTTTTHGPGDIDPTITGPIEGDNMKIAIFKVGNDGAPQTAINYSIAQNNNADTPAPKYGEKFTVVVWNEEGTADDALSAEELEKELTAVYKFQWTLTGTADGVAAKDNVLTTGVSKRVAENDTIQLGFAKLGDNDKHNSLYDTAYNAGAQGFKLKVETTK